MTLKQFPSSYKKLSTIASSSVLIILLSSFFASDKSKSSNFTKTELELIHTAEESEPMRVLSIANYEDSLLLRKNCRDLELKKDPAIDYFAKRLLATVTDSASMGVGIAAPQVGVLANLIYVQRFDKEGFPFEYYINPTILQQTSRKQDCLEGCLSIPNRSDTTRTRSYAIMLEYYNQDFEKNIELIEGFTAVIFQHEIDHLRGILYLDHLKEEK